ncbi:MAG: hypothetical protein LBU68_00785 [Rickettsiales bacterium]|jgi:hypothetical protein|nr:hypothetical protein [Rickettsiales bacterium]
MNKVLKMLASIGKGLLFSAIKYGLFIAAILIIFRNFDWPAGMTFEQWYLKISGCNLNNSVNDPKCLITNPVACWHCQIFDTVWDIMHFAAYKFYNFFSQISMTLMLFAFAFWLLIEMFFKKISGGKLEFDPKNWWKDVATKAFKIIFAITLIFSLRVSGAIKYAMEPVLATGTFFARSAISSVVDIDRCAKMNVNTRASEFLSEMINTESKSANILREFTVENNAYQSSVKNELVCMVWNFNTMLLTGMSAGANIFQHDANPLNKLIGIAIRWVFFILGWNVLIELLDIIMSLGFLLILTPFIIATWAVGGIFKIPNIYKTVVGSLVGTSVYLFIYSFSLCVMYISMYYLIDILYYSAHSMKIGGTVSGAFAGVSLQLQSIMSGASNPNGTFPNMFVILLYGVMMFSLFDWVKKYKGTFSMWNIGFADSFMKNIWPKILGKFTSVDKKVKGKITRIKKR